MSANDNILAGIAGLAEGAAGVYVPWAQDEHRKRIAMQEAQTKSNIDTEALKTRLPYEEASKQRLSQVNVPSDVGSDFGIPPGNMDKEILALYIARAKEKKDKAEELLTPYEAGQLGVPYGTK